MEERMNKKFDDINGKFDGINSKFDGIDEKFDMVTEQLDRMEATLNAVAQTANDDTIAIIERIDRNTKNQKLPHKPISSDLQGSFIPLCLFKA